MSVGGRIILFGAVCAGLAVGIGAFGAHLLEDRISAEMLTNFETGARYHFYHSLGMLAVGILALVKGGRAAAGAAVVDPTEAVPRDPSLNRLRWSAAAMLTGIVLFSGSLYTMALTGETWLGAVTPLGGLALIAGWAALAWGVLRS